MMLPESVDKGIRENAKMNQQKFMSANDLHNTFMAAAKGKNAKEFNISMMGPEMPSGRTCDDIPYHPGSTICACKG